MNQENIYSMKQPVAPASLYGCGLCHNPAPYMCKECRDTGEESTAARSINAANSGCAVPADFIYV